MNAERITQVLLEAAHLASRVSRSERERATIRFKQLPAARNLTVLGQKIVTSADLAVQEIILQYLLDAECGAFRIVAEEDTRTLAEFKPDDDSPTIFIDPIDGTLSYAVGCTGWQRAFTEAGFPPAVLNLVRDNWDSRMYGVVLGALLPDSDIIAVCSLPEMDRTYHCSSGRVFRNGNPFCYSPSPKPTKLTVGRRLIDWNDTPPPIISSGMSFCVGGSYPASLWQIFEGDCTAYGGLRNTFDGQLAAAIGSCGGLLVTDRYGNSLSSTIVSEPVDSLVFAATAEDQEKTCALLRKYP